MRPVHLAAWGCVFIAAGCAGLRFEGSFNTSEDDWTTYGGSERRAHAVSTDLAPPFEQVWTYNAQGGILATPLVRDNTLIVGTLHGELQVVSLTDGKRVGYVDLGGPIRGTPVLSGLYVIVPLLRDEGSLVYFGLREGRAFWKANTGPIESSPLLVDDRVIVSTLEGAILCIRISNGEEAWRYAPGSKDRRKPFRSSPALAGDLILCGNDDGNLYAVRLVDGAPMWMSPTSAPVFAAPVVVGGTVIVANIDGVVRCVDAATGDLKWERRMAAPVYTSPSSDGTSLFVATASGEVAAFDARTGEPIWTWQGKSVINASPLVSTQHVYVGSLDNRLTVLDKSSGKHVWSVDLDGRIKVPPVIWKEHLIVAFEDRTVAAYRQGPLP